MPRSYRDFLPSNFFRLPTEERRAAHKKAFVDFQVYKAQRKVELAAEKAAKAAHAMTCQVCGRPIFAETGVIAHHGYTRPYWGGQTASCPGARCLPFEVDRAELAVDIERHDKAAKHVAHKIEKVKAAKADVPWTFSSRAMGRDKKNRWNTITWQVNADNYAQALADYRENYPYNASYPPKFEVLVAYHLKELSARLSQILSGLATQQARYATWQQTHRQGGSNGEPTWVAL